jgi:tetratricopeptide (TPR) repeat protein
MNAMEGEKVDKLRSKTDFKSLTLLLIILVLALYVAWLQTGGVLFGQNELGGSLHNQTNGNAVLGAAADKDEILSVELLSVNYYEARFKIRYKHRAGRKPGYLTVEDDDAYAYYVGLITTPGEGEGVAMLTRRYDEGEAYRTETLKVRMYDPYLFDQDLAVLMPEMSVDWPSKDVLPERSDAGVSDVEELRHVTLYRNIPDYISFANDLTTAGFRPERIHLAYAVCSACAGSVVYGAGVSREQLAAAFEIMKAHDLPFDQVSFSDHDDYAGEIHIGHAPLPEAKPLQEKLDILLSDIPDDEFFSVLGYPLSTPHARAVVLHAKAKNLIDNSKDKRRADKFLEQALALDSSYVPIYIERARFILRYNSIGEEAPDEESMARAKEAEQVIRAGLQVDPNHANAWVLLGYTLALEQKPKEADAAFNKAEKLGTNNLWLHYNRALNLRYQGKYDEYADLLENSLFHREADGGDNDRALRWGLLCLARARLYQEKPDEALDVYRRIYALFPDYYQSNNHYLRMAIAHGQDKTEVAALTAKYQKKNWNMGFRAGAMSDLIDAAEVAKADKKSASLLIAKVTAGRSQLSDVVEDLAVGDAGRSALMVLFDSKLLAMKQIETTESVLLSAIKNHNVDAVAFLIGLGADPNKASVEGFQTPLIAAVLSGNEEMVKLLIGFGANAEQENGMGFSATDVAQQSGSEELRKILMDKGVL